ncbi:MAG: hypothetical protein OXN20_16075 [Gemmatimonadota bacterium]|nr:hypothetical protein [Gemmatimonadota bacterium]
MVLGISFLFSLQSLFRHRNYQRLLKDIENKLDALVESIAGRRGGIKTISQKIIALEEQKSQIEQEMTKNEATLAEGKQKVVSLESD